MKKKERLKINYSISFLYNLIFFDWSVQKFFIWFENKLANTATNFYFNIMNLKNFEILIFENFYDGDGCVKWNAFSVIIE